MLSCDSPSAAIPFAKSPCVKASERARIKEKLEKEMGQAPTAWSGGVTGESRRVTVSLILIAVEHCRT